MGNSLGGYVIEQYSSSDPKNIKWTQKNTNDTEKSKNKGKKLHKQFQNSQTTIVVYVPKDDKVKVHVEKIFKIETITDAEKLKNKGKKLHKQYQYSSASHCNIERGFKRPAR